MKTAAIIQARMNSSRLPNKVMMSVLGRPLLGWMLERVTAARQVDAIVIATTSNRCDDEIAEFSDFIGCKVFRGSEDDVLDRYYQAACMVTPDAVIRLTADCPLIDPRVIDTVVTAYSAGGFEFVSNTEPLPSSWPDGMDVSIFSFDALEKSWREARKPSEREHVTFHFWNNPHVYRCKRLEYAKNYGDYRLTVDYKEDFELLEAIIRHFGERDRSVISQVSMEQIISFLDANPDISVINKKHVRGAGWLPALERDKQQGL